MGQNRSTKPKCVNNFVSLPVKCGVAVFVLFGKMQFLCSDKRFV